MLAFVDESRKSIGTRDIISIGFFVTNNFQAAYETLMKGYRGLIRRYSLRLKSVEIKFSTLLRSLASSLSKFDAGDINAIFEPIIRKLAGFGYPIAFVFDQYVEFNIIPMVSEYLSILKSSRTLRKVGRAIGYTGFRPSRRTLSLLSMLILIHKLYEVHRVIVDRNLVDKRNLSFIRESIRELKLGFDVILCRPEQEKGILLADFVAGYSRYINTAKFYVITNAVLIFRKPLQ